MYFGGVACRPTGLKVFELLEHAYGLNAYQGLVYFFGPDPQVMKDLLKHQEDLDFYV